MQTLKEYNNKLARLRSVRKITTTMKMVSANKLRRAQQMHKNGGVFAESLNGMVGRAAAEADPDDHPVFRPRRPVRNVLVLAFTSDRGLCGGFNNNLSRKALAWMSEKAGKHEHIELSVVGRRGFLFLKNRAKIRRFYKDVASSPTYENAQDIGAELQQLFVGGTFDEIHLAYNVSRSAISHAPTIERLLPLDLAVLKAGKTAGSTDSILEPARPELVRLLVPWFVNLKVHAALLHNALGEHGARMTAMDNATRNADSLIDDITMLRNRARQSAITTQLIEVVSGAEALK